MENIEFELEKSTTQTYSAPKKPKMVEFLAKMGIRDERMANYILVGVIVLGFILTYRLYSGLLGSGA